MVWASSLRMVFFPLSIHHFDSPLAPSMFWTFRVWEFKYTQHLILYMSRTEYGKSSTDAGKTHFTFLNSYVILQPHTESAGHCISYLLLHSKLPSHLVLKNDNKHLLSYMVSMAQEFGPSLAEWIWITLTLVKLKLNSQLQHTLPRKLVWGWRLSSTIAYSHDHLIHSSFVPYPTDFIALVEGPHGMVWWLASLRVGGPTEKKQEATVSSLC